MWARSCVCATVRPYASVRGCLLATACAGPDICKHRGSIRMRRSPRSPGRTTAHSRPRVLLTALASSAPHRRGHGVSTRCDGMAHCWLLMTLSSSTEIAHRDHQGRCRRSTRGCAGACAPTTLSRSRAEHRLGMLHDHPVAGCHQACLVVTQESSEEVSGLGTCHIIGTVPTRRGHSKPRPRG